MLYCIKNLLVTVGGMLCDSLRLFLHVACRVAVRLFMGLYLITIICFPEKYIDLLKFRTFDYFKFVATNWYLANILISTICTAREKGHGWYAGTGTQLELLALRW